MVSPEVRRYRGSRSAPAPAACHHASPQVSLWLDFLTCTRKQYLLSVDELMLVECKLFPRCDDCPWEILGQGLANSGLQAESRWPPVFIQPAR